MNFFTEAYLKSGGTLFEGKPAAPKPADQYVDILKPYAPGDLPSGVIKPEPAPNARDAAANARQNRDNAYSYNVTTKNPQTKQDEQLPMVRYAGTNPEYSQGVSFTAAEWVAITQLYGQQKDQLAAETPDGGDENKKKQQQQVEPLLDEPALGQEQYLAQAAEAATEAQLKLLEEAGVPITPDVKKWSKSFCRQVRGLGERTLIWKAAQEALELNSTLQEVEDSARDATKAVTNIFKLAHKTQQPGFNMKDFPENDRDFLQRCVRLRGTGKSRGVYIKGGSECGGDLAAIGGDQLTSGGEIYGLKLGTQNSPLYVAVQGLSGIQADNNKPLVPLGRLGSAAANQFNAINGEMNEWYPALAHALFIDKNNRDFKKLYKAMVEQMGAKHNLKLFLEVAKAKAAGDLDQLEIASMAEEGSIELVDDITEEFGETPDEKKALQWLITRNLMNWKNVVENLPACMKYEKVGDKGSGILAGGRIVNADIQGDCGGYDVQKLYSDLAQNTRLDVKGERDEEIDADLRASVKDDRHGRSIDLGKRSLWKTRDLNNADVTAARNRQMDYIDAVDKGEVLPPDWREKADAYREKEIKTIDGWLASVSNLERGALKDIANSKTRSMPYDKFLKSKKLYDKLEAYNSATDDKERKQLYAELVPELTNAYRAKQKGEEGMRYNMAVEAAISGMSTERQAFILTGSKGTYMSMESDVAGKAIAGILGIGGEPPMKMKFTQNQTQFLDENGKIISSVSLRRKGTTPSQFFIVDKEFAKNNMKRVESKEEPVGNSNLTAEDIVGQLQELFQRINEIGLIKN